EHLSEDIRRARQAGLMAAQQGGAFAWAAGQIGREFEVIVDGTDPEFASHVHARGPADAPDIDALVRVKGKNLRPGDLVRVKVTAADGYDLVARAIGATR